MCEAVFALACLSFCYVARGEKTGVKILVLCAVLAAGVLAFVYFTREPSAMGARLSEWLRLASITNTPRAIRNTTEITPT